MDKTLIITPNLCDDGISKVVLRIVNEMDEVRFDIAARITQRPDDIPGVTELIELPDQEDLIRYFHAIGRLVKSRGYRIVYIHGNSAMMVVPALAARTGGARRVITHCHSTSTAHPAMHRLIKPLFTKIPDAKIGCSHAAAKWAYGDDDCMIVPNGIDAGRYEFDISRREELRKELGLAPDETVLGNYGRLSVEKDQLFLIDIFAEYRKTDANSGLILVGDTERSVYREKVEKKIKNLGLSEDVIMLEPQDADKIAEYYNALDVMVMPSDFEGLSLVALESQANGLPLVISDHLSEETYLTDYAIKASKSEGAAEWADKVKLGLRMSRGASSMDKFEHAGLTNDAMMDSIRSLIL